MDPFQMNWRVYFSLQDSLIIVKYIVPIIKDNNYWDTFKTTTSFSTIHLLKIKVGW